MVPVSNQQKQNSALNVSDSRRKQKTGNGSNYRRETTDQLDRLAVTIG